MIAEGDGACVSALGSVVSFATSSAGAETFANEQSRSPVIHRSAPPSPGKARPGAAFAGHSGPGRFAWWSCVTLRAVIRQAANGLFRSRGNADFAERSDRSTKSTRRLPGFVIFVTAVQV